MDAAASSSSSSLPSADLQLFIDNDYELQVGTVALRHALASAIAVGRTTCRSHCYYSSALHSHPASTAWHLSENAALSRA
jgi:hypothetical protein